MYLFLALLSSVKEKGWDVEVLVEQFQKIDFEKIRNAEMVGVSTITPTAPRAYAIADRIRSLGIPVIIGGPHVTFLPEEALEHADYVIRGEEDGALSSKARILKQRQSSRLKKRITFKQESDN